MKRSPLKRKTRLKRSWMRRKPRRRKTTEAGRRYMLRVRCLPCSAPHRDFAGYVWDCEGPTVAHHAGRRPGVGMKCSDFETIALSDGCHKHWHHGTGPFKGWSREFRRDWSDGQIARTSAMIAGRIDTTTGEAL